MIHLECIRSNIFGRYYFLNYESIWMEHWKNEIQCGFIVKICRELKKHDGWSIFRLWFQLLRQSNWATWRNEEIKIVNKLTRSIKSYLPIRCDFKECFLLRMYRKDWFHSMASKCIWFWFSEWRFNIAENCMWNEYPETDMK